MTDVQAGAAQQQAEDVAQLVARYGLKRAGARPNIVDYTRNLWGRRHFIGEFSSANSAVGYSRSTLGQAWQVLTPLLNAGVYYLIFGVLLNTKRGVHNYVAFLVIGIFIFTFTQSSMITGARAISGNLGLTRVLHFPRAVLPLSSTLVALRQLLISLVVLIPIVLITGERPMVRWLLLIPVIVLQSLFCLGIACAIARIGAKIPDTSQILPFVMRTWLYASGVFYSINAFTKGHSHLVKVLLQVNPGGVYVELARSALLQTHPALPKHEWGYAIAWAFGALIAGYAFFWQAEEQYGRV